MRAARDVFLWVGALGSLAETLWHYTLPAAQRCQVLWDRSPETDKKSSSPCQSKALHVFWLQYMAPYLNKKLVWKIGKGCHGETVRSAADRSKSALRMFVGIDSGPCNHITGGVCVIVKRSMKPEIRSLVRTASNCSRQISTYHRGWKLSKFVLGSFSSHFLPVVSTVQTSSVQTIPDRHYHTTQYQS